MFLQQKMQMMANLWSSLDLRLDFGHSQSVFLDWLLLALVYLWAVFFVSLGVYALTMKGHSSCLAAIIIKVLGRAGSPPPLGLLGATRNNGYTRARTEQRLTRGCTGVSSWAMASKSPTAWTGMELRAYPLNLTNHENGVVSL